MDFFSQDTFLHAYRSLSDRIAITPNHYDANLNLHLKYEHHHPTKSFKVRGAFNKLYGMDEAQKSHGVVTGSAGNHGQAIALAAQQLGIQTIVFVPEKTPSVKVDRMKSLGAEVIRVAGLFGDAEKQAIQFARETGMEFVSAYNDREIIAGAGTILVEWLEQVPGLQQIIVPVGGGGLICGMGLAARYFRPGLKVIGVLSEASPYLFHQFYYGTMDGVVELPTLTDGLAGAVEPGSITIDLITHACDEIIQVTEEEVAQGIAYLFRTNEIVEGSGAVGVAAVLAGKVDVSQTVSGAVLTGGNIDPAVLERICSQAA